MASGFAPLAKKSYERKTGLAAEVPRVLTPREEEPDTTDRCPVGFSEMMFKNNDGLTVGQSFPRKASPITRFEENFILGPRHA